MEEWLEKKKNVYYRSEMEGRRDIGRPRIRKKDKVRECMGEGGLERVDGG